MKATSSEGEERFHGFFIWGLWVTPIESIRYQNSINLRKNGRIIDAHRAFIRPSHLAFIGSRHADSLVDGGWLI